MKLRRLKKKFDAGVDGVGVKQQSKASKEKKIAIVQDVLAQFMTGQRLNFVMSQVRSALRKTKGRRWTYKDKALALSLLHSSPKTYRLLQRVFDLPSVKTLKLAMNKIGVQPGFNEKILEALEKKVSGLPDSSKIVVLAVDEVSIKEGITYDSGQDLIEGFAVNVKKTKELANHAIVFMIRGIVEQWKQAVGYFLSSGPLPGCDMKTLLLQCIGKLENIGLKVVVVVADQGANNRNMFKTQLGVSEAKPYFMHGDNKIFAMYDPPHLLKSIRNNLKAHGMTLDDDEIKWSYIKEFYDYDTAKAKGIRMAPKLGEAHFSMSNSSGNKMSVPLAAQILSHTVGAGMNVMIETGRLPQEATPTVELIERMDQLFNAFNGRTYTSPAVMRHAMHDSSGHKEFLNETLAWLKKLKTNSPKQPYCIKGWQLSITALLGLWDHLHSQHGLAFLLTGRLNQDPLENFFSIIRHKGIQRVNPDSGQFRAAFRQCMVDSIMVPGKNSNCEEDVDKFLLTLKHVETTLPSPIPAQHPPTPAIPESIKSILAVCALPPTEQGISDHDTNVLAYIGGYIVSKLKKKGVACEGCMEKITGKLDSNDVRHGFLVNKNFDQAKVGLCTPSNTLLGILQLMEIEYDKVIDDCMHSDGVKASLLASISKIDKLSNIKCSSCHLEKLVIHLMINIRLHHTIKEVNKSLQTGDKRKSHKMLIFAHK